MLDKYDIEFENRDGSIFISEVDYEKMLDLAKNKNYIKNLKK